jgi:tripartite-type tricarboxylate transporter receptor subunit TctC
MAGRNGAVRRAAAAQSDRTIRIISGFPAGGGIDLSARLLVDPLKDALGQPVIVENRTGAAGMIAANAVAKAPPDGQMLLMATSGEVAISHHLYKEKMTYDPMRELAPITLVGIVPCVVVVAEATPVRTPQELVAYCQANAGKLSSRRRASAIRSLRANSEHDGRPTCCTCLTGGALRPAGPTLRPAP